MIYVFLFLLTGFITQANAQSILSKTTEEQYNIASKKWEKTLEHYYYYDSKGDIDSSVSYWDSYRSISKNFIVDNHNSNVPTYTVIAKRSGSKYSPISIWLDSFYNGYHVSQTLKYPDPSGNTFLGSHAKLMYDFDHNLSLGIEIFNYNLAGNITNHSKDIMFFTFDSSGNATIATRVKLEDINSELDTVETQIYSRSASGKIESIEAWGKTTSSSPLAKQYLLTNILWFDSVSAQSEFPNTDLLPIAPFVIENATSTKPVIAQATLKTWDSNVQQWLLPQNVLRFLDQKKRLNGELIQNTYRRITYDDSGYLYQDELLTLSSTDTTKGDGTRYQYTYNTFGQILETVVSERKPGKDTAFYPTQKTSYEYTLKSGVHNEALNKAFLTIRSTVVKDLLEIDFSNSIISSFPKVELLSATGQRLRSLSATTSAFKLDLSSLPSGVYILRVHAGKHLIQQKILRYH